MLLPLYGIGLAIMALMGILVYAVPPAMNFLSHFPESSRGILVVPSLILYSMVHVQQCKVELRSLLFLICLITKP